MAKAFISNPENLPQINHKDMNKKNNHHSNLEWCNNSYNHLHAFKNGRISAKGEKANSSKLTENQVRQIKSEYIKGKVGYIYLAKKFGVFPNTIFKIVNNLTWKHI